MGGPTGYTEKPKMEVKREKSETSIMEDLVNALMEDLKKRVDEFIFDVKKINEDK